MSHTPPPYTVSIVEDEEILREELAFQLKHLGFAVESFASAEQFYRHLAVSNKTVALLDIGLNGEDGLSVCRHLRSHRVKIGIIFVTARSQRDERLAGLDAGADAYLVKPVDIDELVLTIKHLGERFNEPSDAAMPPSLRRDDDMGDWVLEESGGFIIAPNRIAIPLSVNERALVKLLFERRGEACPHAELGHALGLLPDEYNKHRAEVILSRLRERVLRLSGLRLPVRAERNQGYRLVA